MFDRGSRLARPAEDALRAGLPTVVSVPAGTPGNFTPPRQCGLGAAGLSWEGLGPPRVGLPTVVGRSTATPSIFYLNKNRRVINV